MQCTSSGCTEEATFHLTHVVDRKCKKEEHLCEDHARVTLTSWFSSPTGRSMSAHKLNGARHYEIDMIVISEKYSQQVVYLREVGGDRRITILCGIFEATSLDGLVKGYSSPRPLTHDAMAMVIRAFDADVQDVLIDALKEHVYYAKLRMRQGTRLIVVDIRPSDAFCLAMAFECPIFFADDVLKVAD
jgi:uncharacterized protein